MSPTSRDNGTSTPDSAEGGPTRPLSTSLEALADGRYELGATLGAGGMGLVRRARDRILHREVAIKLLADNLASDPDARERFLREGRAAGSISDPHVVAVHDVGEEAGRPYLVMELIDGPSLADVLAAGGPMDPDDVVDVATAALTALMRAHDTGLLHRDIKPGNLLRTPDGTTKVADFGVAEAADAPGLTRTGFVIGTRSYLAPERLRGEPATVRTDLYSLGATLAELLTGELPQDGQPALPHHTPPGLSQLVEALLTADADGRPADAAAALAMLRKAPDATLGAGTEPDARSSERTAVMASDTPGDDPDPPGSPNRWLRIAAVAVGVLAVTVAWQLTTGGTDATDTPEEQPSIPQVERIEDDPAGTARNLADWLLERGDDNGADE